MKYHMEDLTDEQKARIDALSELFNNLTEALMQSCPRDYTTDNAIDRLSEAFYWVQMAIGHEVPEPEPEEEDDEPDLTLVH